MTEFEYKGHRITLTTVVFSDGREEWSFSIKKGAETVRARAETDDLPSTGPAVAAARHWIDKRLGRARITARRKRAG